MQGQTPGSTLSFSSALTEEVLQPDSQVPESDRLFFTLDRRTVGPDGWTMHVLGIHSDENGWWIQVGRADDPSVSVILRASLRVTTERVLAALESWHPVSADLEVRHVA